MSHQHIQNGRKLTDKELNEIIRTPKQRPDISGGGYFYSPFTCYVLWGTWKTMNRDRMEFIFKKMLNNTGKMKTSDVEKLNSAYAEFKNRGSAKSS